MYSQEEYDAVLAELRTERTERKKLSREIRERDNIIGSFETQENFYKTLKTQRENKDNYLDITLNNMLGIVIMMDLNRNFIFGTRNSLNAMGLDLGALPENDFFENFSQIVYKETIEKMRTNFKSVLESQEILEYNDSIEFKNGNKCNFKVAFIPIKDKKNEIIGVMLQLYDETDIQKTVENTQKASEAKSNFLAKTSHEIRTSMNAIMGMVELCARENLSEQVLKYMLSIRKTCDNLLTLTNDILDFSKIESGKMEIMPIKYDVASLIHDIINIAQIKTVESEVLFVVDIDCNLPNKLIGDEVRIRQILLNILINAFKYTKEGFVSITIHGEQKDNTLLLSIEIADTGIGIKQENIERLFETGLGLTVTKNLCDAMGGSISVNSVYGKGSTFTVNIPQLMVEQSEKIASVQNPDSKKVLLHVTNDIYANSILKTFDNLGVECTSAKNYDVFCMELKKSAYHFVFVSADIFAQAKKTAWALGINSNFIMLKKIGDMVPEKYTKTIILPIHAISIANILNEANESANPDLDESFDESRTFVTSDVRVLIVDDISINLIVAESLMAPYMMQIDTCTNGRAAIEKIRDTKYDIVFMDHMMPELDGIETTQVIRNMPGEYFANLPIIALTANAMSGTRNMFLQNGMNDLLTKPIELSKLNDILDKWLPSGKKSKYAIFKPLLDMPQESDTLMYL